MFEVVISHLMHCRKSKYGLLDRQFNIGCLNLCNLKSTLQNGMQIIVTSHIVQPYYHQTFTNSLCLKALFVGSATLNRV